MNFTNLNRACPKDSTHIPWVTNLEADKLAQIGAWKDRDVAYPMESLQYSSINDPTVNAIDEGETWMTPIIKCLKHGELPPEKI